MTFWRKPGAFPPQLFRFVMLGLTQMGSDIEISSVPSSKDVTSLHTRGNTWPATGTCVPPSSVTRVKGKHNFTERRIYTLTAFVPL